MAENFNIYKWRREMLTENTNAGDLETIKKLPFAQAIKSYYGNSEPTKKEVEIFADLYFGNPASLNENEDISAVVDEFKSKFRSVSVYLNQRGDTTPSKKSPYDIKAKFDFRWGAWDDVEEQETSITNFFKEKGFELVDSFEYDDDDRRASLTLYYKK